MVKSMPGVVSPARTSTGWAAAGSVVPGWYTAGWTPRSSAAAGRFSIVAADGCRVRLLLAFVATAGITTVSPSRLGALERNRADHVEIRGARSNSR